MAETDHPRTRVQPDEIFVGPPELVFDALLSERPDTPDVAVGSKSRAFRRRPKATRASPQELTNQINELASRDRTSIITRSDMWALFAIGLLVVFVVAYNRMLPSPSDAAADRAEAFALMGEGAPPTERDRVVAIKADGSAVVIGADGASTTTLTYRPEQGKFIFAAIDDERVYLVDNRGFAWFGEYAKEPDLVRFVDLGTPTWRQFQFLSTDTMMFFTDANGDLYATDGETDPRRVLSLARSGDVISQLVAGETGIFALKASGEVLALSKESDYAPQVLFSPERSEPPTLAIAPASDGVFMVAVHGTVRVANGTPGNPVRIVYRPTAEAARAVSLLATNGRNLAVVREDGSVLARDAAGERAKLYELVSDQARVTEMVWTTDLLAVLDELGNAWRLHPTSDEQPSKLWDASKNGVAAEIQAGVHGVLLRDRSGSLWLATGEREPQLLDRGVDFMSSAS